MIKRIAIWIISCLLLMLPFAAMAESDGQGVEITVNGVPLEEVIDTASGMFADAVEENVGGMIDGLNDLFAEFARGFSESLGEIEDMINNTTLDYFCYSNSGSSTYEIYSYEVGRDEDTGEWMVNYELHCGNETYELPADEQLMQELQLLVERYELRNWDGFSKTNSMVLDGSGFSLEIDFTDGSSVSARGSNSFPDGFDEAKSTIDELFNSYLEKSGATPAETY